MNSWKTPREKLLRVAVDLIIERGHHLGTMAAAMVDMYYTGNRVKHQTILFDQDLHSLCQRVWEEKRLAQSMAFQEMAEQLQVEGWQWLGLEDGSGVWQHQPTGWTVNKGGDVWPTYEEATRRSFESSSRGWLLGLEKGVSNAS